MKWTLAAAGLACFFTLTVPVSARMGDTLEQALFRYGQPASTQATPGALTSTRTFYTDGLQIVCGFVNNRVEAISFSRSDRAFTSPEVQALVETNSQRKKWNPDASGSNYTQADGTKAVVKDNSVTLASAKWLDALAKDEKAAQAKKDAEAAQAATETNAAAAGTDTNAAP
jgi:hypothetical protein